MSYKVGGRSYVERAEYIIKYIKDPNVIKMHIQFMTYTAIHRKNASQKTIHYWRDVKLMVYNRLKLN